MKKVKQNDKQLPTLTQSQATGGEVASKGLRLQSNVALAYIPQWLTQDGFSSITIESMGDIEAKFFSPGHADALELIEVKDHAVGPAEFWREIKRFRELHAQGANHYRMFILVCRGVSPSLSPLMNALRRVRDPLMFYGPDSHIAGDSFNDLVRIVKRLRRSEEDARFLFDLVRVDMNLNATAENGRDLFFGLVSNVLPEYQNASALELGHGYAAIKELLDTHLNQPISRQQLERILLESVQPQRRPAVRAVNLHTMIQEQDDIQPNALRFQLSRFFGGENRSYPPSEEWDGVLLPQLKELREWIIQHRNTRRIRLSGNRRLSTSLAIGSVFSAVSGFSIEMELREGQIWKTEDHANEETPEYRFIVDPVSKSDATAIGEVVAVVSIGREILSQVTEFLPSLGLNTIPVIHIHSTDAIVSSQQANKLVANIKQELSRHTANSGGKLIHLFFSGPAFVALLLGHRLNAVGQIQCYEWVCLNKYVVTCRIY